MAFVRQRLQLRAEGGDVSRNDVVKLYRDANAWTQLSTRCLTQDFSWTATAAEYMKAYRRVTRRARARREE